MLNERDLISFGQFRLMLVDPVCINVKAAGIGKRVNVYASPVDASSANELGKPSNGHTGIPGL